MDLKVYQNEIEKLEKEINFLSDEVKDQSATKQDSMKILKYKNYLIVFIFVFFFLYIFRPVFILKVLKIENNKFKMVINSSKFIMFWFLISSMLILAQIVLSKIKKK